MAYFVWIQGRKGPEPQRFDEWPTIDGRPLVAIPDNTHELDKRTVNCRLDWLIRKFPYKPPSELT